MNEAASDKLLQTHFRKTFDIQGVSTDKEGKLLDMLRRTFRILAVEHFRFFVLYDFCLFPASRTDLRNRKFSRLRQILSNLGNNHIGFIYGYRIPDSQC